jgi:hypothetical protein
VLVEASHLGYRGYPGAPSCPNLVLVVVTFAKRISGQVKDKSVKLTKTGLGAMKISPFYMGIGINTHIHACINAYIKIQCNTIQNNTIHNIT